MAAAAKSGHRRLFQLRIFAVQPLIRLIRGETRIRQKNEGAPQIAKNRELAIFLDELITGNRKRTSRPRSEQTLVRDQCANIAEPNVESFGDLWEGHTVR